MNAAHEHRPESPSPHARTERLVWPALERGRFTFAATLAAFLASGLFLSLGIVFYPVPSADETGGLAVRATVGAIFYGLLIAITVGVLWALSRKFRYLEFDASRGTLTLHRRRPGNGTRDVPLKNLRAAEADAEGFDARLASEADPARVLPHDLILRTDERDYAIQCSSKADAERVAMRLGEVLAGMADKGA